jgi:hypothetical protein
MPLRTSSRKVFGTPVDLWTTYKVRLAFRDKLLGGIPRDPNLVEGWLRSKAGLYDPEELRGAVARTVAELRPGGSPPVADDDMGSEADSKRTVGFKSDDEGLYVESRQIKAMLKESTNVVFAGERWGPTRKACKSFFAERVFVEPDRIQLGVIEPTGRELVLGHVSGPAGPRSTLTHYEYILRPLVEFRLLVLHDCITAAQWRDIWCHAQESGFGTLRSQGHGRFDVVQWECLLTTSR